MEAYQNAALSPEERAKDLLGKMTLQEKVGQLNQRLYGFRIYERQGEEFTLTEEFKEEVERMGGLGVLYGLYRADPWADKDEKTGIVLELSAKAYNIVQKYVIDHSRLGIPMMMSTECPHGHQALGGGLLPVNLAAGATFDPELLSEGYKACGKQLKSGHVDLALMSALDMARDLVKEYTAAMREAGLKVGLYYSLIDWSDPRYRTVYPEGMKKEDCLNDIYGSPAGKEEEPEKWQEFLEFNNHQLKELMSNYGTVDLLWFDGDWERSAAQWKMPEFREYLHTLNPNVVLNSRMQGYGDYETPEQGIPLYGPKGEWEFCTTINDSWGYRPSDNDYKSSGQIVRMFCDCITLGGRMLLDIGPKEDGTLDERQEKVLLDLGGWIHDHKEAVFGTEKGLDYNHFLGGSTISADKKTMYLFVYDKPQETLCVKGIKTPVKRVTVLHTGEELRFSYTGSLPWSGIPGTLWIWAGEMSIHPFATVVKVELEDEITYNLGHGEVVTFNE